MSAPFKRETRYVVVKVKDANTYLSVGEKMQLEAITAKIELGRRLDGKRDVECVCVESDWPEYEPTWKAIEARMKGGAA
jgi:hypothetical protein